MKSDILLVGQTPPPFHGQSVVTGMLFDHDWGGLRVERLRMAYSDSIDDVGKAGVGKVLHLLSLIWQTWILVLKKHPEVLYYLPASANKTPVIRDIIYLAAVRWLFSKTVFHYHAGGLPEYLKSSGVLGKVAKRIYANADLSIDVIETSPATGSLLLSKKSIVVRNGLDVELCSSNRDKIDIIQILYVGVLNEGKGIIQIVETARILRGQNLSCMFKIVGGWVSSEFKEKVEILIQEYNLEEFFHFTGSLNGGEKWQTFADADCFFFPSHYEAETFGMVLVEAMAFSLPLVTTRWRGIPLVVEGEDCATLCDIKSPDQYAKALKELIQNPEKRKLMGEASRKHYEGNYTREKFVWAMEGALRGVLKS